MIETRLQQCVLPEESSDAALTSVDSQKAAQTDAHDAMSAEAARSHEACSGQTARGAEDCREAQAPLQATVGLARRTADHDQPHTTVCPPPTNHLRLSPC